MKMKFNFTIHFNREMRKLCVIYVTRWSDLQATGVTACPAGRPLRSRLPLASPNIKLKWRPVERLAKHRIGVQQRQLGGAQRVLW
jgi:hypothetical protein